MKKIQVGFFVVGLFCVAVASAVTAPEQINYQAKVEANGVPFDGAGHFKFAIVDQPGTNTYWSNDGTSVAGSEPTSAVQLSVNGGLMNVMLGDAALGNMTNITSGVFLNPDTWLRIWFGGSAGTTFEKLGPDSKLASVPYAQLAETVPDKAITGEKLARESVWPQHEGRPSDCIVTYYAEYTGTNMGTNIVISADKNFIITDVIFSSLSAPSGDSRASVDIRYTLNASQTILLRLKNLYLLSASATGALMPPVICNLKSGLVVPAGASLEIGGCESLFNYPQSCTVSGFEIPVE